jgi:hypothetical protein
LPVETCRKQEIFMRPFILALPAAALLTACNPESESPAMPTEDACGAAALQHLVGQDHTSHDFAKEAKALRIIPPNSAVTMDHRPDRLNVDIDDQGTVTRIWCG